jgi:hypothetical protein
LDAPGAADVLDAYRQYLLAHGAPGGGGGGGADAERYQRLDRHLRAHLSGRLWLDPDELATVHRFNERLRRERPDLVSAFVALIANYSPAPQASPTTPTAAAPPPPRVRPTFSPGTASSSTPTRVRPETPATDASGLPTSSAHLNGIRHAVYWYRHWALKGFPSPEDRRDAGVEALLRRLEGVLRGDESEPLYLSPDERRAVRTINAVVEGKSPGCVDRFMGFLAPEGRRPPPPPSAARWQQARGSVTAARTPEDRRRVVAAYRKVADEYGAHGEKWGGYPATVDSLVRRLDALLRDGANDRWFPIHLDAEQWQAVRDVNGWSGAPSPDAIDRFVALLAAEPTGGDRGRLRAFDDADDDDWERRLRRRY